MVPISKKLITVVKDCMPDVLFLSISHRQKIGRFPNLKSPTTFNEKILYRCLHPDPRFAELTDKLTVRDYVARKIGAEHLIPLIADPDSFTEAVFESLPTSFVMKANHGSGFVKVVRNKAETTFQELSQLADKWLTTDFYRIARERHYRTIKPKIFFETLLLDRSGQIPPDLKLHCFHGAPGEQIIYIAVISGRFGDSPRGDMYDSRWNRLDIAFGHYPMSDEAAPCPHNLAEILDIAKVLSADFGYVRVDLYAPDDEIFFGELTFTHGAGVYPFGPDEIDYKWGALLKSE